MFGVRAVVCRMKIKKTTTSTEHNVQCMCAWHYDHIVEEGWFWTRFHANGNDVQTDNIETKLWLFIKILTLKLKPPHSRFFLIYFTFFLGMKGPHSSIGKSNPECYIVLRATFFLNASAVFNNPFEIV